MSSDLIISICETGRESNNNNVMNANIVNFQHFYGVGSISHKVVGMAKGAKEPFLSITVTY